MERPKPRIDRPDRSAELLSHVEGFVPELLAREGVVGVTLNGGLSRGYADHLSEIDITIFLEADAHAAWSRDALWDASYAQILADPDGRVAALLDQKLRSGPALQGHQMMGEAVNALVRALFLANDELVPHEKWLVHMSRSLPWAPSRWEERLAAALSTGDLSVASVQRRQQEIELLWNEIDGYARRDEPELPVRLMQKMFYELLVMLADRGEVVLTEWTARAPAAVRGR